jgi:hypothetical protein
LDWPLPSYVKFRDELGKETPLKDWMTVQFIASQRNNDLGVAAHQFR